MHFKHQFQVRAPLQDVVSFHDHPRVLKILTPPPIFLRFHEMEPMRNGSSVDFTIWMGPLPVRWKATHSDVEPQKGFTDTQTYGPFEKWVHQHHFIALDESTTKVLDKIEANPGASGYRRIISRIMWITLPILFRYREFRTRLALEKGSKKRDVIGRGTQIS